MKNSKHIVVQGLVQGVGFRYHTKLIADKLLIKGTVKNLPDGRVEIYCKGEAASILDFIDWLRYGSPAAKVSSFSIKSCQDLEVKEFNIIR